MAAKKRKKQSVTTVRFPADLAKWLTEQGVEHPRGTAGVIRDACYAKMQAKQDSAARIKSSLLGALE